MAEPHIAVHEPHIAVAELHIAVAESYIAVAEPQLNCLLPAHFTVSPITCTGNAS